MSDFSDVMKGRLVYTCNCGWIDTGHANSQSYRPNVGATSLWAQIQGQTGLRSKMLNANGYKVTYSQDMILKKWGMALASAGIERSYYVPYGLSLQDKESVALSIFMEVSYEFEDLQGSFPFNIHTSDSSFSEEDLLSDLVGFYIAVRPGLNYIDLCKKVSVGAAAQVWNRYGAVGSNKNYTFKPQYHPCSECQGKPNFPPSLNQINAVTKGTLFRDWKIGLVRDYGAEPPEYDEVAVMPRAGRFR